MSATTNLGKVSVTPKGAWAITNTYEILDIVTSGGSSYLAKQNVPTGVSLTNTSYWIMIAEKGDGGEITSASASISGGYGTPGVSVTAGGTAHERTLAFAFTNLRGEKGETGNGIDSVYKTGTSGLVDTYTILFTDGSTYEFEVNNGTASIDDTLTKSGWAADAKVVGDTKASIDGFYETMGVGVADNLTPYSEDSGASQDIPFIAQGTGCGNGESVVDTGSYCQLKNKLGNTVGVNQQVEHGNFDAVTGWICQNGGTITASGNIGTCSFASNTGADQLVRDISLTNGHTFLISLEVKQSSASAGLELFGGVQVPVAASTATTDWQTLRAISSGVPYPYWILRNSTSDPSLIVQLRNAFVIDLTLWFGSNDRIPSDLLSHPENWGRYYAGSLDYNAGTLESADGTVMKSIGRQVWNEADYYTGKVLNPAGTNVNNSATNITCGTFDHKIEVIPNSSYAVSYNGNLVGGYYACYDRGGDVVRARTWFTNTFTVPSNCVYVLFSIENGGGAYNHDITISLYYPGESGYDTYYPFSVLAEVDTGSEVLRSAGAVADEKTPDGTITRRVGVVDLGTLTWYYDNSNHNFYASSPSDMIQRDTPYANIKCSKYPVGNVNEIYVGSVDYAIGEYLGTLRVVDSRYTDAATFKSAMSGVYLFYELATPTTEQGTAFAENIPCDDFGSMYWTQTKGIPQGNEIFYPVDYKASIDTLYNRVEGDMSRIVIDDDLADYNTKAEDAATYATKEAAGGVLRQVLAVGKSISFANTAYVCLGDLSWSYNGETGHHRFQATPSVAAKTADVSQVANILCSKYTPETFATVYNNTTDMTVCIYTNGDIIIYDSAYTDATTFKAAMNGVLFAYEKASS